MRHLAQTALVFPDRLQPLLFLAPFAIFFLIRVVHYVVLKARGQSVIDEDMARRGGETVMLGPGLRQVFAWSMAPFLRWLSYSGVSPNTLTVLCLVLSIVAGVLIGAGQVAWGGVVGILGSSLDYLDGRIARGTGRATRAGDFLDGTLDRYCDTVLLAGAAVLFRSSIVVLTACLLGLGASLIISYARAKAEALGVELEIGLMQRSERIVLFCAGAVLGPIVDPLLGTEAQASYWTFAASLVLLAVLSTATAVHRTLAGFQAFQAHR